MWLLMKTEAAGCAYENAEALARYEGFTPAPMRNGVFIQKRLTLTSADGGLGLATFEPRLGCCA